MRALIITYYWPPAGGSGVQRWLKFAKYLQDFDIEPVIYTVENPEYAITDHLLESEVPENIEILRQPIWEPNNIVSIFKNKKTKQSAGFLNSKPSFFGKILQYIRANYFIPDARKFWIQPSVTYLKEYIEKQHIDIIITTGPPHSLHLIGLELKGRTGIKWISDFRDPWTDIDYFHQLPFTKKSKQKHRELEEKVLRNSDAVLLVGKTMKENYKIYNSNIYVLTNGFDTEASSLEKEFDTKFSMTHIGMMNADRNPEILWKVLSKICTENLEFQKDLSIKLIGKIASEVEESISIFDKENLIKIDYLSHEKVRVYQQRSQVLILAINNVPSAKGIITGKIFEYLQAKRPILAIGPLDGDAAEIINSTNSGTIIDFDDEITLKNVILSMYKKYKAGNLYINSENIDQYHRKELTRKLSEIIVNTCNISKKDSC